MAWRVMRLGAEYRRDLEDTLEDTNHDLLVELRALREVAGLPEVVQTETVGATLGGGGDDLGREDLRKAFRTQSRAVRSDRGIHQPEPGTSTWVSQCDRGVIEQHWKSSLELGTEQLERRRCGRHR